MTQGQVLPRRKGVMGRDPGWRRWREKVKWWQGGGRGMRRKGQVRPEIVRGRV